MNPPSWFQMTSSSKLPNYRRRIFMCTQNPWDQCLMMQPRVSTPKPWITKESERRELWSHRRGSIECITMHRWFSSYVTKFFLVYEWRIIGLFCKDNKRFIGLGALTIVHIAVVSVCLHYILWVYYPFDGNIWYVIMCTYITIPIYIIYSGQPKMLLLYKDKYNFELIIS